MILREMFPQGVVIANLAMIFICFASNLIVQWELKQLGVSLVVLIIYHKVNKYAKDITLHNMTFGRLDHITHGMNVVNK